MSENALYIIRLIDFNDSVFKYYMINLPSLTAVSKKTICRKSNRNKMTKDDIVSSVQMMEGHQNMRQFTARFTGYSCMNASNMLMSINAAIIISAVNGGTR